MILHLDPSNPLALYLQLVEQVKRLVALGALRSGDRLPSVRELAVQGRVNRNTVARAVQALEAAGIVRTRVGQGTFVAEGAASRTAAERDAALDGALDRLVVEAASLGAPLDPLPARLSERIRSFRKERSSARATADGEQAGSPARTAAESEQEPPSARTATENERKRASARTAPDSNDQEKAS